MQPVCMYNIILSLFFQTNVPDVSRLVQRIKIGGQVRGVDGHRSSGQQAISVRVPPELLAGRGESGSSGAGAALRSSGLAVYRRPATKASGLVRKGQADEQRHGQARPGKKFREPSRVNRVVVFAHPRKPAATRDVGRISISRENNLPLRFGQPLTTVFTTVKFERTFVPVESEWGGFGRQDSTKSYRTRAKLAGRLRYLSLNSHIRAFPRAWTERGRT
mgnify:CR=1 FL=1